MAHPPELLSRILRDSLQLWVGEEEVLVGGDEGSEMDRGDTPRPQDSSNQLPEEDQRG